MRSLPAKQLANAYAKARRNLLAEYVAQILPLDCPFTLETEALAEEWWPGES